MLLFGMFEKHLFFIFVLEMLLFVCSFFFCRALYIRIRKLGEVGQYLTIESLYPVPSRAYVIVGEPYTYVAVGLPGEVSQ